MRSRLVRLVIALCLALGVATPATAQNAYRNSTGQAQNSSGAGTVSNTYDAAVLSGSLLLAGISIDIGATVSNCGDTVNGASSWSSAGAGVNNGDGQRLELWYKPNTGAGTPVVTCNLSASVPFRTINLVEVTGADTATPIDKYSAAVGNDANPNSGSQTTTTNGQYIFGVLYHTAGTISSYGSYTSRETNTNDAELVDQVQTSAGSVSVAVTMTGAATWSALMATVKAAGGGGATPTLRLLSLGVGN